MDPTVITTGYLVLRPWEAADGPAVFTACQDPEVQRWTGVPSPYAETDARQFVEELAPAGWADGTAASFAVLDATSGDLLAAVGLHRVGGGTAEIGFWCAAPARGRGVVSEAVGAVCRWAFAVLGLDHVLWRAAVGNSGSRAVAEKCGFAVQEGVRRHGLVQRGSFVDCWSGTLLSTDEVRDRRGPSGSGR